VAVQAPTLAADSLAGTWQHQRDSGGWKVHAGGSVTMLLDTNGQASLTAVAPNQNPLTETGTWSQHGMLVTIKVAGELEIDNKPCQLQGDTLTLPEQLSTNDPGTSTWVRVKPQGIGLIFQVFDNSVVVGDGGETAAQEAAKEARKQESVEQVEVLYGGEALAITAKPPAPGAGKPKVYLWFASKPVPRTTPAQRPGRVSLLAGDPRTHLNANNPKGDPDAPQSHSALVVAPYQSKAYLAFRPEVWSQGDTKPRPLTVAAQSTTFQSNGDDPQEIVNQLKKAGYTSVTFLLDDAATPGAVYHALQSRPSVIYFATHGGVNDNNSHAIGVAGFIGVAGSAGNLTVPFAVKRLHDLLTSEGVPGPVAAGAAVGCMEEVNGRAFCFPILSPGFFAAALGSQGVPDAFVFLDACHTASYPAFAKAFKAKVFLGYDPTVNAWASARITRYLFTNMARPGHSVREAWDRALHLTEGAGLMWPEDSILSPDPTGTVDLKAEAAKLKAWGTGLKPYDRIHNQVFWLMRLARHSTADVNEGASALGRCLAQYWTPPGKPAGLADLFCNQGGLGNHTPTDQEVNDARHLVSGRPAEPSGRFVLR
jgi:hypothetical protein